MTRRHYFNALVLTNDELRRAPVAIACTEAEVLYLAELVLEAAKEDACAAREAAELTAAGLDSLYDWDSPCRAEEVTAVRAILDAARDIIHRDRAARRAEARA